MKSNNSVIQHLVVWTVVIGFFIIATVFSVNFNRIRAMIRQSSAGNAVIQMPVKTAASLLLGLLLLLMVLPSEVLAQPSKNYTSLSEAAAKPEQVYWLTLRGHGLENFPREILAMKNLRYLDLSGNAISNLPEDIDRLGDLRYFDLSGNSLNHLPERFGNMQSLRNVYVSFSGTSSIAREFELLGRLGNLTVADIADANGNSVPWTVGLLSNVQYLGLGNFDTSVLPAHIAMLDNLLILSVRGSRQFDTPENIEFLSHVRRLREVHLDTPGSPGRIIHFGYLNGLAIASEERDFWPRGSFRSFSESYRIPVADPLAPSLLLKF
jgi:hypothetical protein